VSKAHLAKDVVFLTITSWCSNVLEKEQILWLPVILTAISGSTYMAQFLPGGWTVYSVLIWSHPRHVRVIVYSVSWEEQPPGQRHVKNGFNLIRSLLR
jgi:hypothetical protein